MEGIIRILRRFVAATLLLSLFLLLFNFVLLGTLVFTENDQHSSPEGMVQQVAKGLEKQKDSFQLDGQATELLRQNHAWAMLLGENGHVIWDYHLPHDVPDSYNLVDVAKFSRYYLMDYPVYTSEHQNGLMVVGYPKESHWKYQLDFLAEWISSLPLRIVLLLLCNLALALLISIAIGTRLIRKIRPLVDGVHNLAREQEVQLDTKGIFGDLARSMNSASAILQNKTAALQSRDEARANWIAGISHDIRTPLSLILGYASEMEDQSDLTEEQRHQAGIIRSQGEKLRSLVSDLNLVSMLEYEMQPLHLKYIRLSVLGRQVVTEFVNHGLDDRYDIELKLADEAIRVHGDEKLLLRAISNLVQNSVRHNPQGCKITIETSLSQDRSQYRMIVRDDGRGIPQEQLAEITELYFSARSKRPAKQGHGLGLPMVARIAKAHHGHLILASGVDQRGLTAIMEFPVQSRNEKVEEGQVGSHR